VVVVAPHRAWIEPFLLVAAWPSDAARLVWLADGATVTRSWWRRLLLPRLGVIPIEGSFRGPSTYAELAAHVLAAGAAVAVFPESGPPSPPGHTRPIKAGFAYLARGAGAPVVPVVVAGTHHIVRGSTFGITFLEAIDVGVADPHPFARESRAGARELSELVAAQFGARLPGLDALSDARRPKRERWRWLGRLFG
jgi:1-acyl-sn-glycerol-3-phosphate acyltransferase